MNVRVRNKTATKRGGIWTRPTTSDNTAWEWRQQRWACADCVSCTHLWCSTLIPPELGNPALASTPGPLGYPDGPLAQAAAAQCRCWAAGCCSVRERWFGSRWSFALFRHRVCCDRVRPGEPSRIVAWRQYKDRQNFSFETAQSQQDTPTIPTQPWADVVKKKLGYFPNKTAPPAIATETTKDGKFIQLVSGMCDIQTCNAVGRRHNPCRLDEGAATDEGSVTIEGNLKTRQNHGCS